MRVPTYNLHPDYFPTIADNLDSLCAKPSEARRISVYLPGFVNVTIVDGLVWSEKLTVTAPTESHSHNTCIPDLPSSDIAAVIFKGLRTTVFTEPGSLMTGGLFVS